ncbi:fatty acyl-CoA reductase 1-like [Aphidius gifuensis]|uniref:fatty acyl-CoA reductase 1-like n=1 Tax=Aphidius gifuensis TaxID=684658 RepID=UPI001CDD5E8F|nr:fatty acyl-CoA reductase 1-like [Aphidius gifuensis]
MKPNIIEINHKDQYNFDENSIQDFFTGSIIFITGSTGFLGKALLEKLLRSCKKISIIYILLRSKNGQTIQQRLEKLMDNLIFDRIKFEYPDCFTKVIPINGDISQVKLGLSENDYCLLFEKVNIVFHCAATVGFNEPFKTAINQNVGGTKQVIDLCLKMFNLKSFVYVSTAYTNKLQDKHPNTYTLTKNFAENLINNYKDKLPIAIVRPSIISGAVQEPFPGWVDNFIGATGVMAQVGVGLAKSIFGEENKIVDLIPIDIVVNTLICASWNNIIQPSNKIQVYNCVSGPFNPLR